MQFDFGSLLVAIIGAVVVLLIYRLIVGRGARQTARVMVVRLDARLGP
jgi:Transglycosylase associated protein